MYEIIKNTWYKVGLILSLLVITTTIFAQNKKTVCREIVNASHRTSYEYVSTVELTEGFEFDATKDPTNQVFDIEPYQERPSGEPNNVCQVIEPYFVEVEVIRKTGIKTDAQADDLPVGEKIISTDYIDGLGRSVQSVIHNVTPDQQDIVKTYEYDQYGRMIKDYLPFVESDQVSHFEGNVLKRQADFYSKKASQLNIKSSEYAFSEVRIEKSPLQRVLEVGATGKEWQLGEHTATSRFGVNDEFIKKWKQHPDGYYYSDEAYRPRELVKITVLDEEKNRPVEEYRDGFGNVVYSRAVIDAGRSGPNTGGILYAETYNVYDDLLRLVHTISPNGVEALRSKSRSTSALALWELKKESSITQEFVESFVYDKRGRLITNNLQGAESNEYVYDQHDRLITFRNAAMKADNDWWFVKYDYLNRPIESGRVKKEGLGREEVAAQVKNAHTNREFAYEKSSSNESNHYYTSVAYPVENGEVLNVYYYDKLDLNQDGNPDYSLDEGHAYIGKEAVEHNLLGLSVASKTKVLGDNSRFLWGVNFYDEYYRVVQSRANNALNSSVEDAVSMAYNDKYETYRVKESHIVEGDRNQVTTDYSFDYIGRPKKVRLKVNAHPVQDICEYRYNELGMLVEKNLHKTDQGRANRYIQSVDYGYNIRGWVTNINDVEFNITGTVDDDDLFALKLMYANPDQEITQAKARYDGMLSGVVWNVNHSKIASGKQTGNSQRERSYTYEYDGLNRLVAARYRAKNGDDDWSAEVGGFDTRYAYDRNGNITNLQRYQLSAGVTERTKIDDLVYSYRDDNDNWTNKIQTITDRTSNDAGYKQTINADNKYRYDKVGNLKRDPAKGVSVNHSTLLNLPTKITKSATEDLTMIYTASGSKIGKVHKDGSQTKTTYYIGSFVYENTALAYMSFGEGRIVPAAGNELSYEYNLTDHLGNTRVTFRANKITGEPEIIQENHYYPYGLGMKGVVQGTAIPSSNNPFKHGGKEEHAELGLDWYMYSLRMYDPTIGRWLQQDPYNEFFSPYCGMGNNPANFNDPTGGWLNGASGQGFGGFGAGGQSYGGGYTGGYSYSRGGLFGNKHNSRKGVGDHKPGHNYKGLRIRKNSATSNTPNSSPSVGGQGEGNKGTQPIVQGPSGGGPSSSQGEGGGLPDEDFSILLYNSDNYDLDMTSGNQLGNKYDDGDGWILKDIAGMSWEDVDNYLKSEEELYGGEIMNLIIRGHGGERNHSMGAQFLSDEKITPPTQLDVFYSFIGSVSQRMSTNNGSNGSDLVGNIILTNCRGGAICSGGSCLGDLAQSKSNGREVFTINKNYLANTGSGSLKPGSFWNSPLKGRLKAEMGKPKNPVVNAPYHKSGGRKQVPSAGFLLSPQSDGKFSISRYK